MNLQMPAEVHQAAESGLMAKLAQSERKASELEDQLFELKKLLIFKDDENLELRSTVDQVRLDA